jgi:hypothetical protein
MRKQIATAFLGVCLAAMLATSAEARLDHGLVPSLYDQDSMTRAKPNRAQNFKSKASKRSAYKSTGKRQARSYKRKNYASRNTNNDTKVYGTLQSRAVTAVRNEAGGGGGGGSRGCLQPAASALLSRIEAQFGPVQIVSTCRPGATIRNTGKPSKHRYGLAIDFDAGGRKGAIVQWLIANHHSGGTMTYAGMSHIHVDIGQRFVSLGFGGGRKRIARS